MKETHQQRLQHIDDLLCDPFQKSSCYHIPSNAAVEGFSSYYMRVNVDKLFTILEKIPLIFFVLSWTSYFVDPYIPEWDYDGWFIRYNFLKETRNFIICSNDDNINNSTTPFWTTAPSLLRMTNLHSLPSVLLRAGILPIFFGRFVLLTVFLKKWRFLRNADFGVADVAMYFLMIMEVFSLNIFFIGNHPIDDERIHKLVGIIFVFITVINMLATTLITYQMDRIKSTHYNFLPLCCFTAVFGFTVILTLNSYYYFVDRRKCSPLVEIHLFFLEVVAALSYILFHWNTKSKIENIEILLYSTITEMEYEKSSRSCKSNNPKNKC